MRKLISFWALLLSVSVLFTACDSGDTGSADESRGSAGSTSSVGIETAQDPSELFTDRDYEVGYDESTSVLITLSGSTASCNSSSVAINGSTVTITGDGTYILSGTLDDGMIIVNAGENDKPQLVLNGVYITSATSAPLYILEGDKVFVTLADGTENVLENGATFEAIDENDIDAAVFSKQDLTFNGSGSLPVTSPAGHGIVSKDDLVFTSGTYTVTSASHGIDANDSVRIANASFTVDAGKDGIRAENNDDASLGFVYISSGVFSVEAEGDGISAGAYLQIESGTFDLLTGGGSANASKSTSDSYGGFMGGRPGGGSGFGGSSSSSSSDDGTSIKGLKAASGILIADGSFTIDAADDAIHSNTSVIVNGGTFIIATGDDGIHADESLRITAGTIHLNESYEGLEALHVEIAGGDITLVSGDDGINAAGGNDSSGMGGMRPGQDMFGGSSSEGSVVISGGTVYINASGDGIDANGTLTISGGHVTVCGPTSGDTSVLDYDKSAVIAGGTFIGTGAYTMAQTFSDSEQGVLAVRGTGSAGTLITLTDADGNVLISYEPKFAYQLIILSTPDMVKGEEYTITVGSQFATFEAS